MLTLLKKFNKIIFVMLIFYGLACFCSCNSSFKKNNYGDFTCFLDDEMHNGKYRFSWSLNGSDNKTRYDVLLLSSNGTSLKNSPSLSYMDFDLVAGNNYTLTIKLKNDSEILKMVKFNVHENRTNEIISASNDQNNVTLSFTKQLDNSECYFLVNDKVYKNTDSTFVISSLDINYKSISFSERCYTTSDNELAYEIIPFSSPTQIQIVSDPSITFKANDGNSYLLKCDKFNKFDSFDISLIQDNEKVFERKNINKGLLASEGITVKSENIKAKDLDLEVICHGSNTNSYLICDNIYTKTYEYIEPSSLDVVNGVLKISDSLDIASNYLISQKAYYSNKEENFELKKGESYTIPKGDLYNISVLPILSNNYFTILSSTGWLGYYDEPELTLVSKDELLYNVRANLDNCSKLVLSLSHNGNRQSIDNVSFIKGSASFSLKDLIKDSGEYILEASISSNNSGNTFNKDGIEFKMYSSQTVTCKIIKTPVPSIEIGKIDNGNKLYFSCISYDTFNIRVGNINDTFSYDCGVSSYILSNNVFDDSFERTIEIRATKNIYNDPAVVVIESEPLIINEFKIMDIPSSNVSILTVNNEQYFSFENEIAQNYYAELYYEDSIGNETRCGSFNIANDYKWKVTEMFNENLIKAGSYRLAISKTSSNKYALNSKEVSYYFNKLETPIFNKSKSSKDVIYWDSKDTVNGYQLTINSSEPITSKNNNYRIDENKLIEGESIISIIAIGDSTTFNSEPLEVKLYKLKKVDLNISNSILSFNYIDENVKIYSETLLYDDDYCISEKAVSTNNIDLIELTSNAFFNLNVAKKYRLDINFSATSSNYDYIYGYTAHFEFIKQAYPSINVNTKQFSENNGQSFVMAIDGGNYIYNNANAPIPSGKHYIYFKILGDGINTIDSNAFIFTTED